MRVLVTGASGFIGGYTVEALQHEGHSVVAALRNTDALLYPDPASSIERLQADIFDGDALAAAMNGCDAVVHLVGIIEESPRRGITFERMHHEGAECVMRAARAAGIDRFVLMSANGVRADGVSRYQTSKWAAEEAAGGMGFGHVTIVRPSLVFGDPGPTGDEFATRLARTLLRPFPIWPIFGDGSYEMQPIDVRSVATVIAQAVSRTATGVEIFELGGPDVLPYKSLLPLMAEGLGMRIRPMIHQPVALIRPMVRLLGPLGLLPISIDQFEMLLEGNVCSDLSFKNTFNVRLLPFNGQTLSYLRTRS